MMLNSAHSIQFFLGMEHWLHFLFFKVCFVAHFRRPESKQASLKLASMKVSFVFLKKQDVFRVFFILLGAFLTLHILSALLL